MFEKKDVDDENEIIEAKALPGTKKKKPANLPNEFVTNDDFCPGCGLELKSLPTERIQLWTDVFRRDLGDGFEPSRGRGRQAGAARFRGWGLERFLSADRRAHVEDLRADIKAMQKALPPKFAYVHGVGTSRSRRTCRSHLRGNPFKLGDEVPRHFLTVLSDGEPVPFAKGSGRLELADAIVAHPLAAARDRQPRLEGTLRHRPREHAQQLRRERRAADASRAARVPRLVLRRPGLLDEAAASRHHAERGLPVERGRRRRPMSTKDARQPALLARQPPPLDRRADSRLRC